METWKLLKRVLPQHTDHAGVMWHGSYLNLLEEARVLALSQVGLQYKDLVEKGFEMPVVSLTINYKNALNHGDCVLLESRCLPRQRARWPWLTTFLKDDEIIADARVEFVLVKKIGGKYC